MTDADKAQCKHAVMVGSCEKYRGRTLIAKPSVLHSPSATRIFTVAHANDKSDKIARHKEKLYRYDRPSPPQRSARL